MGGFEPSSLPEEECRQVRVWHEVIRLLGGFRSADLDNRPKHVGSTYRAFSAR